VTDGRPLRVLAMEVGPLAENTYIVGHVASGAAVVIDPGDEADEILGQLAGRGWNLDKILLTHGTSITWGRSRPSRNGRGRASTFIRTTRNRCGRRAGKARCSGCTSPLHRPRRAGREGDTVSLGDVAFRVLHTPGHTPGHVTYLCGDLAFVGDLIFEGSIGRTDLPGGSLDELLRAVREKIFTLPGETILFRGTVRQRRWAMKCAEPILHGGGRRRMTTLSGKEIVLGITGGIAAYKGCEIVRALRKEGAGIRVILTASGARFITPLTLQTLSRNPVYTDLFDLITESEIGHISLAQRANLLMIAPATANILGKIRGGIADDMLSTVVMATAAPVLLAPAMNSQMYASPAVRENVEVLRERGFTFVEPDEGELACGTVGPGRLADTEKIVEMARILLAEKILAGKRVVVGAGPTAEDIDPVRFLTNRSAARWDSPWRSPPGDSART